MSLLYYSFCALSVLLAWIAEKRNNRILFVISMLLIAVLAGARGRTVGIDTDGYYTYIDWAERDILKNVEPGFIFLSKHLLRLFGKIEWVVFFYSSLTVLFIYLRFWTLRSKASFTLMTFFYLAFYFQLSLNVMRQFFALSIVFLATYLLEKRKYFWYLPFVALAVLFHYSALFGIVIFIFYYWNNTHQGLKKLFLILALLIAVPIAYYYLGSILDFYSGYFDEVQLDIGLMIFAKLAILVLFIIFNRLYIFKGIDVNEDTPPLSEGIEEAGIKDERDTTAKTVVYLYILGLALTFLGYIFKYMERVGFVFMIFEPVMIAFMCKRQYKGFFALATISLATFIIVTSYISNGNGVFPYTWIF